MGTSMDNDMEDDNDSDLEAELLALSNSGPKAPTRRKHVARPQHQMNANLDAMVDESMKDIPSDEDLSADENDPELLGELSDLMGKMYNINDVTKIISLICYS